MIFGDLVFQAEIVKQRFGDGDLPEFVRSQVSNYYADVIGSGVKNRTKCVCSVAMRIVQEF
jgi:hypothetical protein